MDKRLDTFGELVMVKLRDQSLEFFETLAAGEWKAPSIKKLQRAVVKLDDKQKDIVRRAVRASVDTGIHDGIHGEPFGDDGWQARFSEFGEAPEED